MTPVVTWDQAIAVYLERCEGNGLSPKSIENYQSLLTAKRATAFRELHGVSGPADLTPDVLEALKGEYRASGLSPHSVHDHYRAWRTFARFCFDRGWLTSNAILKVQGPRQPKRSPRGFSDEDLQRLLAACSCNRDRVLVQFMVETGLRRQEVVNLVLDDLVVGAGGWVVRVRQGKGSKDRSVPMSPSFSAELERYIQRVRPQTESAALFLTTKRTGAGDYTALTGDGLYRVWNRLGKATGLRAYPHGARHTFATQLAQDGVAPWAIQRSLGHTTIDMTQGYVNLAAVDLKEAFSQRKARTTRDAAPPAPTLQPPPISRWATILQPNFQRSGDLPPWFTRGDGARDRMWLQHLYLVFCAVANHLELPRESGVLVTRYGLSGDMLVALLEVSMHATVELPEDVIGEEAVEATIATVNGALTRRSALRVPCDQKEIPQVSKSLTSVLFRAARLSATGRAVRRGTVARRAKNIVVGRALRRVGFWRRLWR